MKATTLPVSDTLSDREIDSLIAKLAEKDRLNRIKAFMPRERVNFFKYTHRRSLFDGLAAASHGRSLLSRAEFEYGRALSGKRPEVARLVLLSAELGYPLSEGMVARMLGIEVGELAAFLEADEVFGRVIRRDRGRLIARHQGLAARISKTLLEDGERWRLTIALATALSPYVDRRAISRRTLETRLCGQLMDADRIVAWFGQGQADDWYQNVYDSFAWNSRFWEQRSLAEVQARIPRFERAEAWANEAVSRHRDAFSLNTLGTVLLRRATSSPNLDSEAFLEGLEAITSATTELKRPSEHPYVTALSYLARALRRRDLSEPVRSALRGQVNDWVRMTHESEIWRDRGGRRELQKRIAIATKAALL